MAGSRSQGILVWYGQPSEVQFTRGGSGGRAENFGILDPRSVYFVDSRGIWGKKWYGQYRSDCTVCDAPEWNDRGQHLLLLECLLAL